MKKWGTKSDLGGAIIFFAIALDSIFDLNPYLLIAAAIIGLILIFSSIYDYNKKRK